MLVSRPGAYSPIKKTGTRTVGTTNPDRLRTQDARYDSISLSSSSQSVDSPDFRQLVASLSQQVRTYTTTGKVQELHSQVQSGEYQISATDIAARMLLLEEDV